MYCGQTIVSQNDHLKKNFYSNKKTDKMCILNAGVIFMR